MVSRNYKVSATVGVSTVVATPVFAILDTGAGPNLVREDVLPEDWLRYRVAGDTTYQVIGAGGSCGTLTSVAYAEGRGWGETVRNPRDSVDRPKGGVPVPSQGGNARQRLNASQTLGRER